MRNTTPESYELYEILRKMVDQGCQYVVMEVSVSRR
ncbi:MAG: Mur ligase family protein [Eubacterium ramulus]